MSSPKEIAILDEVGRWKVIWIKDLYRLVEGASSYYASFCKKIRALERKGYLSGRYFADEGKYVYLTEKGAILSSTGAVPGESTINHDLICTEVILKLLEFENFHMGSVPDGPDSELEPDGVIHAMKDGNPYTLAIEVELSRKSQFRIERKFADYAEEGAHEFVLYITNKPSLFSLLCNILSEMNDGIRRTIILSLAKELGGKYDYRKSVYWFDGGEYSFDELFKGGA